MTAITDYEQFDALSKQQEGFNVKRKEDLGLFMRIAEQKTMILKKYGDVYKLMQATISEYKKRLDF